MIRLISDSEEFKQKEYLHDFFSQVKMLIIMSKAFLGGYPLEPHRLQEIANSAENVIRGCVQWHGRRQNFRALAEAEDALTFDHIFFQRVKLLATMAKSFAGGNPMGRYRQMALENNIEDLCHMLRYVPKKSDYEKISVA